MLTTLERMAKSATAAAAAAAAAAGVSAAEAVSTSAKRPTLPQLGLGKEMLTPQNKQDSAAGIGALVIKATSVQLTALSISHSSLLRSRETAKGADVCERGDPLFFITQRQ